MSDKINPYYSRKTSKTVYVALDEATYSAMETISAKSGKAMSQIAFLLINTAVVYNFAPDMEYICHKQRRTKPIFSVPCGTGRKVLFPHEVKLRISEKSLEKLSKAARTLCVTSYSETARTLIHIALDYDYNDKLKFSPPEKYDFDCNGDNSQIADNIFLDII